MSGDGLQIAIDPEAREFYEEAAAAAAAMAVCIDLYVVSEAGCGLSAIEPLTVSTGGLLFLYPTPQQAALPQVLVPPSPARNVGKSPLDVKVWMEFALVMM